MGDRQTSGDYYGCFRAVLLNFSDILTALCRCNMSNAAGIDNDKVCVLSDLDLGEIESFEQFSNLLAFVLVDFAAKRFDGKSIHIVR